MPCGVTMIIIHGSLLTLFYGNCKFYPLMVYINWPDTEYFTKKSSLVANYFETLSCRLLPKANKLTGKNN